MFPDLSKQGVAFVLSLEHWISCVAEIDCSWSKLIYLFDYSQSFLIYLISWVFKASSGAERSVLLSMSAVKATKQPAVWLSNMHSDWATCQLKRLLQHQPYYIHNCHTPYSNPNKFTFTDTSARSVTFCNSEAGNSWSAHFTAASSLISKLFDLTKCTCVNTPDPISSTIPFCEPPPPTCEKNILLKPCEINLKMQFTAFYPHTPLVSRWFSSSFSSFAKAQPCKWKDMKSKS